MAGTVSMKSVCFVELEDRLERLQDALEQRFPQTIDNPVLLLRRIQKLLQRLKSVQARVDQVNKTKQELIDACTSTSIAKSFDFGMAAKDLETCVDEARENFVSLLKDPANGPAGDANLLTSRAELNVVLLNESVATLKCGKDDGKDKGLDEEVSSEDENRNKANVEGIKAVDPSSEINREAFLSLPESVKGRARYDQVQHALNVIKAHFQDHSKGSKQAEKTKVLSLKELDSLGAKVTGVTGRNILHTLRSLGFIQVSKAGVTLR